MRQCELRDNNPLALQGLLPLCDSFVLVDDRCFAHVAWHVLAALVLHIHHSYVVSLTSEWMWGTSGSQWGALHISILSAFWITTLCYTYECQMSILYELTFSSIFILYLYFIFRTNITHWRSTQAKITGLAAAFGLTLTLKMVSLVAAASVGGSPLGLIWSSHRLFLSRILVAANE